MQYREYDEPTAIVSTDTTRVFDWPSWAMDDETPSMRTERAPRQSRCHTTFLHVTGIGPDTLTPFDRA